MLQKGSIQRFDRAQPFFKNYLASKFIYKSSSNFIRLKKVHVSAGPFKNNEVSFEHGFILTTLTGVS
jgi:hypothetical protein